MAEFSPWAAVIGGVFIGIAAVLLLLLNGRIAGVSGILFNAVSRDSDGRGWRLMFLAGLVLGGLLHQWFAEAPLTGREGFSPLLLVSAGLLVGYGTRMGSGCTSGHGVCGIGRLSVRSIIATCVFLLTGIATAVLVHGVLLK